MPPKPSKFRKVKPRNPNSQKPVPIRFRGSSSLSAVKTVGSVTRDSNTVLTPAGPFPKDKVHLVPKGARVHHARDVVQIIGADGTILHSSPISKSVSQARTSAGTKPTSVTNDGLVAYCHWHNTDTDDYISNFSTAWTVPNPPHKDNGQTIYIYNALCSDADIFSDDCDVLQPTLQYGDTDAGGGSYWAIASWYYSGDDYYVSKLVEVSCDDRLVGIMTMTGIDVDDQTGDPIYSWNITFSGYPDTSLNIDTYDQFPYALECLEIYDCDDSDNLPNGTTQMESILLQTGYWCPDLSWTTSSDSTDDISVTVVEDGIDGYVDINYPS